MSDYDDDTRALAIIGNAFGLGLLSTLESKQLLTPKEVDTFLESVLTSLEGFLEPNDPGIKKARVFVDGMAQIVAASRRMKSTQPP